MAGRGRLPSLLPGILLELFEQTLRERQGGRWAKEKEERCLQAAPPEKMDRRPRGTDLSDGGEESRRKGVPLCFYNS